MSVCRVFSCVGRGCLLWPVRSLGKTLLAFALLHSVLWDQVCLLFQVFLDFLSTLLSSYFYVSINPEILKFKYWNVLDFSVKISMMYLKPKQKIINYFQYFFYTCEMQKAIWKLTTINEKLRIEEIPKTKRGRKQKINSWKQ